MTIKVIVEDRKPKGAITVHEEGAAKKVIITEVPREVIMTTEQIQGPTGLSGKSIIGPQGIPGADATNFTYIHYQGTPEVEWTIVHNMNKYPTPFVEDSGGNTIIGFDTIYDDPNQMRIIHDSPFGGEVFCN